MTFKSHGIDHISPSSLNLWQASPGLWALRYLARVRDEAGAAAVRGTAVESGLKNILYAPGQDSTEIALLTFDVNVAGEISEEIAAERARIPGMVKQCSLWKPPSAVAASQLKVELWLDGVEVPLIGYLDFSFMCGTVVDLKTTKACPSAPKPDHIRQVALYSKARDNCPVSLLYVTHSKHAYYPIEQDALDNGINELHAAALSLQRFLSLKADPEDLIRALPIDRDNFRFSQAAAAKLEEMHL